jgi:hypothetical protein
LSLSLGVGLGAGCGDVNGSPDEGAPSLALDAFPNQVVPSAEALVTVTVNSGCDGGACTLCVGVPPGMSAGALYIAGLTASPQSVVSVTAPPIGQAVHVVYRAPATEGAEVVTGWLYDGTVDCSPVADGGQAGGAGDLSGLVASASVRITVSKASTSSQDAGAGSSDAGATGAPYASDGAASDAETGASGGG